MTCADVEILLCDYQEGVLPPGEHAAVEAHVRSCAACAELDRDARAAVAFFERVPAVEPPRELVTRLLHQVPRKGFGLGERLGKLFGPVLQPRMVMSMALIILSFSTMGRLTGIQVKELKPSDLNPAKVWAALDDRLERLWDRSVKYYESMRFVYEMQGRLREWMDQEDQQPATAVPAEPAAADDGDSRRLPVRSAPGQPAR